MITVYTCVFGDYEKLNEVKHIYENVSYICVTDNPNLTSLTWKILVVSNPNNLNPIELSRFYKFFYFSTLPPESYSIYIDNTVDLQANPHIIVEKFLYKSHISVMQHSSRKNLRDEFLICSVYKLDKIQNLFELYKFYKKFNSYLLQAPLYWCGLIVRKNTKQVLNLMNEWYYLFLTFCRRDQLTFPLALQKTNVTINVIIGSNANFWSHNWPILTNRRLAKNDLRNRTYKFRKLILLANYIKYYLLFKL